MTAIVIFCCLLRGGFCQDIRLERKGATRNWNCLTMYFTCEANSSRMSFLINGNDAGSLEDNSDKLLFTETDRSANQLYIDHTIVWFRNMNNVSGLSSILTISCVNRSYEHLNIVCRGDAGQKKAITVSTSQEWSNIPPADGMSVSSLQPAVEIQFTNNKTVKIFWDHASQPTQLFLNGFLLSNFSDTDNVSSYWMNLISGQSLLSIAIFFKHQFNQDVLTTLLFVLQDGDVLVDSPFPGNNASTKPQPQTNCKEF